MTTTKEPIINIDKLNQIPIDVYKAKNPNSFPFWVFPKAMQDIIFDCNKTLNFPIDFLSASILFSVGLANGVSTVVEVKKTWQEKSLMYLSLVGRAGTNKSHPLKFALAPILKRDAKTFAEYSEQFDDYEKRDSADKSPVPTWSKTIIQDATKEAVNNILVHNKRGVGVFSDELKGWLSSMDKYSDGKGDMEYWLSAWNSTPIIVERSSSRVKAKRINTPFVSVVGTIQNKVLKTITGGSKSENGFIERILFVIPQGLKKYPINDNEISELTMTNYKNIITTILDYKIDVDEFGDVNPLVLRYTDEAKLIHREWDLMNTIRYNSAVHYGNDGLYAKMESYIHRLALILQIMTDACQQIRSNKITEQSIKGAVELAEYFVEQAKRINTQNKRETIVNSDRTKKGFYNDLPNEFETKTAIEIGADGYKVNARYVERFLAKIGLFEKIRRGYYRKLSI